MSLPISHRLTDEQYAVIRTVDIVAGCLSSLGASFIIISFLLFKNLRTRQQRLLFFLAISDFFLGLSYMMTLFSLQHAVLCYLQAICITIFSLSTVFWHASICTSIFVVIRNPSSAVKSGSEIFFNIFSWGIPIIMAIILLSSKVLGDSNGWCWIDDELPPQQRMIWILVSFYIPLWITMSYILFMYALISVYLIYETYYVGKKLSDPSVFHRIKENNKKIIIKFAIYPLIFVLFYIMPTANRISQFFGPPIFWLVIIHSMLAHSIGLTNAVVYGLTQGIHKLYIELARNLISYLRGKKNDTNPQVLRTESVTTPAEMVTSSVDQTKKSGSDSFPVASPTDLETSHENDRNYKSKKKGGSKFYIIDSDDEDDAKQRKNSRTEQFEEIPLDDIAIKPSKSLTRGSFPIRNHSDYYTNDDQI